MKPLPHWEQNRCDTEIFSTDRFGTATLNMTTL